MRNESLILYFGGIILWVVKLSVRSLLFNNFPVVFGVWCLWLTLSCWLSSQLLLLIWSGIDSGLGLAVVKVFDSFLSVSVLGGGAHGLWGSDWGLLDYWEFSLWEAWTPGLFQILVQFFRNHSSCINSGSFSRRIFLLTLSCVIYDS